MNKMRIEIPTCRRCCLCLPLRYGLITYGYLRLMLASIILFFTSLSLHRCLQTHEIYRLLYNVTPSDIIIRSIVITMVVADIILGVIFIISCHKKNVKWMSNYYVYNLVLLSLFIPLTFYFICSAAYSIYESEPPFSLIFAFVLLDLLSLFAYNVLQVYAVLLIRSEIIKLKNNCEFRFENISAEAECSLRIDNSIEQTEREGKKRIDDNGVIKA